MDASGRRPWRRFHPDRDRSPRRRGFSLVELLISLAIALLLLAFAWPNAQRWIGEYEVMNQAQHLAGVMNVARSEAIKRGYRVNVCKTRDWRQCDAAASWADGFIVFVDADRDGQVGGSIEAILRAEEPAPRLVTVTANRPVADYVSYTSLGSARMLNGALQMGTITVCRQGQRAVDVVLANSGRARIQRTAAACP